MKNKKLLILSSLFLTFAMTSCGENFPSHISYPEGDDGSVQTPYEEYDNGKRVESISFKENDVSLNLSVSSEYQIEASIAPSDAHNPKLTYESNTPDVAVVDDTGKVTMVAPGNASISVKADNGVSANFNISGYIPATSIKINPHVEGGALLDIYDTKQFAIATEPANATQKDVTWSVVDKDGNPTNVALISETGLLSFENAKGVHDLEFNVIATSKVDASLVASEKVIVNDARKYASSVKISKDGGEVSSVDVLLGSPVQLEAVVDPIDHTNPVSWSSEDATVATVDEGLVSAVKAPASTNVKASIDGLESKVVVNTTKVDVTAVSLDKTSLTLNKGEEAMLVATVAPSDASFPDVAFVVADGSNEFVSIDDNGKVTAKKQTGATPAKVMAVSKDNNEIYAECSVTVTNKVTAIEIVNNYEKMYYGGETYTLSLNKTPYDCEDFDVTWTSSNDSIATVDADGVVTTNNAELTGTVTIEATVNGTDIGDFIDINIIKPAAPFTAGKMYLVGNRNYQASGLDFDHASWDDSDYAVELTSMPDASYKNQWALNNFHFERYNVASNGGDLFKIRSVDWPEFSLDQSSTKSAYFTEEGNLAVSNSEKYDLYFKENLDDSFSLYIMSEFKNGTMYLVGNRDYHTGESSGVAGTDTSWNDSSKALALNHDEAQGQYHVANTFEANDEFKVRSDMFYDIALGTDEKTTAIAHVDQTTGNIVLNKAGKFDIYFKSELGVWTVYMHEYVEPVPFMWGIAGSHITDWGLDTTHPFVESTVEGDAKYTYKISGYEFSENTEWKVKNTNNEWVANQSGVGFDSTKSTANAFSINNGNIKVLTAGTYDITLNIWEGATKDEYDNFINGVQIYAVKQAGPVVPSITFGVSSPEVEIGGYSQIPVTTSECSDIDYSVIAGDSYVEIVDAQSDDTKLVVHGLQEGTATIKALASNGTFSTIDVKCAEAPETSRFYIETKPWFNSGSLDEHVYVYTYKADSDPMKENAVFPGEEATYVKDLDAGKKLFYFDIAEIYDTFIVTKRVGTTNSYQTNDIAISDFGTDNCMWMGDEPADVATKIETGHYNYALGLSVNSATIGVGGSANVSITNFIGDISYVVDPASSATVSIVEDVATISSSTLGTTTITFSDESSSAPVVFTLKVEETPATTRVYFETKSWFNSNQPGEKVYAYAFKNGSNPIEQNAAWPGEEATWLRDGDNGKKIFYFDVLGDYDTIIFVRVVDGTSYAQTSDISLSAMGENNCVYLVSDSYPTTPAEVGYYTLVV
ncbi:MAG: Ig-like domain-containing protein [Bacilli bacterium]|nr:Ig-like domain-containing protein [Bacilli bacterium]